MNVIVARCTLQNDRAAVHTPQNRLRGERHLDFNIGRDGVPVVAVTAVIVTPKWTIQVNTRKVALRVHVQLYIALCFRHGFRRFGTNM